MTQLLVGTKKGLFALQGDDGSFEITARQFAGEPCEFAIRDPRSGRYLASVTSAFYGPKVFVTDDPAGEWQQAEGLELPEGEDKALVRLWSIVPGVEDGHLYAGGDPGVLFESRDGGMTWELNEPFWNQPTRPEWNPGAGGMCVHSIATWPGDPKRIALGISAVGVWLSDDGGETWRHGNQGLVPRYIPEESREKTITLCVHNMHRHPTKPERLFMQFHGGVYRSDDAGESWIDIGTDTGLPSDFGFPLALDPDDSDSAYVIPLVADLDRVTPEGRVRVYETRDAGQSWTPRGDGLPAEDAYLTILRQAFGTSGSGQTMQLYFGATSGDVFGSRDAGGTWFTAATKLPPVNSVRVA
jgi:BNR/Asp-box repeat